MSSIPKQTTHFLLFNYVTLNWIIVQHYQLVLFLFLWKSFQHCNATSRYEGEFPSIYELIPIAFAVNADI